MLYQEDITIADTGVATIAAGAVDNAMLAGSIENAKLTTKFCKFWRGVFSFRC